MDALKQSKESRNAEHISVMPTNWNISILEASKHSNQVSRRKSYEEKIHKDI